MMKLCKSLYEIQSIIYYNCSYLSSKTINLMYRIVSFVCEVLICANYASCHGLTKSSYSYIFVSANCTCHSSMLVISLYVRLSSNTSKEWKFLLHCLTQKAKGLQWLCASRGYRHLHCS